MTHSYARGAFAASMIAIAGCSSAPISGAGGASPIGCDTVSDCGNTQSDVCIECRDHECVAIANDSGVCK